MNKIYLALLLLILVGISSYFFMPSIFEAEGGSCYQGITAMIIRDVLVVSFLMNLFSMLAIIFKKQNRITKTLSLIAFIMWISLSVLISSSHFIIGVKYFSPLLIVIGLIMIINYKKNEPSQI